MLAEFGLRTALVLFTREYGGGGELGTGGGGIVLAGGHLMWMWNLTRMLDTQSAASVAMQLGCQYI